MVSSSMDLYSSKEQTEQKFCSHVLQVLEQRRHNTLSQKLQLAVMPSKDRIQHRLWSGGESGWGMDDLVSFPWESMRSWNPRLVCSSLRILWGEGSPLLHIMGVSLPLTLPSGGSGDKHLDGGELSREGFGVCNAEIFSKSPSTSNCLLAPARSKVRVRS